MRTRVGSHVVLAVLVALGSVGSFVGTAHAADDAGKAGAKDGQGDKGKAAKPKDDKKDDGAASASVGFGGAGADADVPGGEPAAAEEEDGPLELTADAVVGFGRVPALNPSIPVTLGTAFASSLDDTKVTSDSYILGVGYWLSHDLRVRVRLPIAHASYRPGGLPKSDRGSTALGNVDLAVTYEKHFSKSLRLVPQLAVGLPTAGGTQLPSAATVAKNPTGPYDQNTYDRFSDLRAANAARGLDEGHLWASNRFGIVPEVELVYEAGKLDVAPFVRMDNLLSTSSTNTETWVADFVGGVRVGYTVADWVAVGIRGWASYALQKEGRDDNVLVNVEPNVSFHVGPIHPYAGLLVPVFPIAAKDSRTTDEGPVYDVRYVSFRLGVYSRF